MGGRGKGKEGEEERERERGRKGGNPTVVDIAEFLWRAHLDIGVHKLGI